MEEVTKQDLINVLKECEELVSKMKQGPDKKRRDERDLKEIISDVEKYNGYSSYFRDLMYKSALQYKDTLLSESRNETVESI
jgi:hypothetical protein